MAKGVYIGVKQALPSGYTELDYIESTGTQYIDTGFKANQDTRVVVTVESAIDPSGSNICLFGGRTSSSSKGFGVWWNVRTNNKMRYDYSTGNSFDVSAVTNEKTTVDANKEAFAFGGYVYTANTATFQCDYNLFLLAMNTAGAAASFFTGKLYSCKIYDNGTLVRNYVPCTNDSGVVGLYDFANSEFYNNAGSGVFTAGNAVNSPDKYVARKVKKAYIGIEGVARKIKKAYIGIVTDVPIYEESEETVTLTSANIADYFDVVDGTYCFTGDTSGRFSSYSGTLARNAVSTWTAKCDIANMSMSYFSGYYSGTSYLFEIDVAGEMKVFAPDVRISGALSGISIRKGESIVITATVTSTAAYVENISFNTITQVGTETKPAAHLFYECTYPYEYTREWETGYLELTRSNTESASVAVCYADGFNFDAETGEFRLLNPSSINVSYSAYEEGDNLAGKYFILGDSVGTTMYLGGVNAKTYRTTASENSRKVYIARITATYQYTSVAKGS